MSTPVNTDETLVLVPARVALRLQIEEFYFLEADLLDERRYEEWLDLLAEDIRYRVPISRNVHSSATENELFTDDLAVSWMDEGKETLTHRVEQFRTGIHWAEEPVSRTSHLYTNIRVLEVDDADDPRQIKVKLRFLVYRNRLNRNEDFLIGKRVDTLVRVGADWRISVRSVHLDQTVLLANNLTTFL
jgi:3-phenylpropionate/cinnamic acid dioxygenase small subunit